MKKILFIYVAICSFLIVYSQDIIDPPTLPINFNDTLIYDREFGKNYFIRGWNWGGSGKNLDEAMLINYYHTGFQLDWNGNDYSDTLHFINGHRRMIQLNGLFAGRNQDRIFNGHSLYLEPTITVDSSENFQPREGDNTGGVYGFRRRAIGNTTNSGNEFGRYLLYKDSITSTPKLVLDSIWDGRILRWFDYDGDDNGYGYDIGRTNSRNVNSQGNFNS